MKHLYALLVGIDNYLVPAPLSGCVADIEEYEEFLSGRVDRKTHELHLQKLIDAEATRAAILDGFHQHLSHAGPGDTALFVFCGHGSQQPSDKRNWKIEPDHQDETLVCYESRIGGSDLADKVISQLLDDLSAAGAHVVVVLDSCHSGSGTRDVDLDVRYAPARSDVGPAGYPSNVSNCKKGTSGWTVPAGSGHVLLAACGSHETAKEFFAGGRKRGVFSACLLETLKACPGSISYQSLYQSTAAAVRIRATRQNPQFEAGRPADLDLPFMGGSIATRPRQFSADRYPNDKWMLNLGAVHGMPDSGEIRLLLFPRGTTPDRMKAPENAAGRAIVSRVFAASSQLRLDFTPEQRITGFEALIESTPAPLTLVALRGDAEGVLEMRAALQTAGPNAGSSPFVGESEAGAQLVVRAKVDAYEFYRNREKIPFASIERKWPAAARLALEQLEHIACWQQVQDGVSNPNSSIRPEEFKISLFENGKLLEGENLRLDYREKNGELQPPGLTVQLQNSSSRRLFFALLALTESFEIAPLLREQSVLLDPGETLYVYNGEPMEATLPNWLLSRGGTETVDTLKILVSTSLFDGRLLRQPPLDQARSRSSAPNPVFAPTNLNLLLNRMQHRNLTPEASSSIEDWIAANIRITIVRPPAWMSAGPAEITLPRGTRLACPSGFFTRARLNSDAAALHLHLAPAILTSDEQTNWPFRFLEPCGADPGLGTLELSKFSGSDFVTPGTPIRLSLPASISPASYILPFAFDGRYHIPLGRLEATDGTATIYIERLPRIPGMLQNPVIHILFQAFDPVPIPRAAAKWREWAPILQALALNALLKADWKPEELAELVAAASAAPNEQEDLDSPETSGSPTRLLSRYFVPGRTFDAVPAGLDLVEDLLKRMGIDAARTAEIRRFFEKPAVSAKA